MKKKIVVLVLALTSAVFSVSARDILSLKNGSVIKGELIEATGEQVKFKTADGSLWVYGMSEVISVTKEKQAEETVAEETEAAPKKKKEFSKKGYRTQIEQTFDFGDFGAFGYDAIFGYQFNSHLQLGGGIGLRALDEVSGRSDFGVPLYADFKVNFLKTKVTPFFDLKAGSLITADPTFYISPSVGVKIHFSKARALSISTGLAWAEYAQYEFDYYMDGYSKRIYNEYYSNYTGCAFSFKINYQF
jgi:hypothetical protein